MLRREFMMFVGGASALPLKAIAQARKWRIGFLHPGQSVTVTNRIAAFREGLGASGLAAAADAEIVARIANEQLDQLPAMAADLVGQSVQTICAVAPAAVSAAREVTRSVPIIAMDLESDPVANGWAASLAHPGGNITGIFLDLPDFSAKSLQLLREAVPSSAKIAVLWHPASRSLCNWTPCSARRPSPRSKWRCSRSVASRTSRLSFARWRSHRLRAFDVVFAAFCRQSAAARRSCLQNRLPAISNFPDFARNGGLIGYGPDLQSLFMQAGLLTRKVLEGAAIADLPVERPTRFKLVTNLKTAHLIGVTMPTSILLLADEVIE